MDFIDLMDIKTKYWTYDNSDKEYEYKNSNNVYK